MLSGPRGLVPELGFPALGWEGLVHAAVFRCVSAPGGVPPFALGHLDHLLHRLQKVSEIVPAESCCSPSKLTRGYASGSYEE